MILQDEGHDHGGSGKCVPSLSSAQLFYDGAEHNLLKGYGGLEKWVLP